MDLPAEVWADQLPEVLSRGLRQHEVALPDVLEHQRWMRPLMMNRGSLGLLAYLAAEIDRSSSAAWPRAPL